VLGEGEEQGWGQEQAVAKARQSGGSRRLERKSDQPIRLGIGERLQEDAVDDAEDGRIGADADLQGKKNGDGAARGPRQSTSDEFEIG